MQALIIEELLSENSSIMLEDKNTVQSYELMMAAVSLYQTYVDGRTIYLITQ